MIKNKFSAYVVVMLGLLFCTPSANAANPYNISYTGGEDLGANNLQVAPEMLSSLTRVIGPSDKDVVHSFGGTGTWEEGYMSVYSNCTKVKYFRVWDNSSVSSGGKYSFTAENGKYKEEISFEKVVLDGFEGVSENQSIAVIIEQNGSIATRRPIYSENTCTTQVPNVNPFPLESSNGALLFIETNIKLYEKANNEIFTSNELYFGLSDVDAAQSFKVLNSGNMLSKDIMYVKSLTAMQPSATETNLRNKFVGNGNYIYSEFNPTAEESKQRNIDITDSNNCIFVKTNTTTQKEGLRMVFGFAGSAGSGTVYYVKQFKVTYDSDSYGKITGIEHEDVVAGNNPSGSTQEPNEGYSFEYWVADVDVTLKDGTVIKAGEKMNAEQIRNVVVDKDVRFTAIHSSDGEVVPTVAVPDTGEFVGDSNAMLVISLLTPIVVIVLLLANIYNRKTNEVGFKKK